jgi:hypothetical protein
MNDEIKQVLILCYPGLGQRRIVNYLNSELFSFRPSSGILLDDFGFRDPPNNYWGWYISIPILRSRLFDLRLKDWGGCYVGWGCNWQKIINENFDAIGYIHIDKTGFFNLYNNYRKSIDYIWDLKLINIGDHRKEDISILDHYLNYQRFIQSVIDYCDYHDIGIKEITYSHDPADITWEMNRK